MQPFFSIVIPTLLAFTTTVIITPICLIFIKKLGLIDNPKTHIHPAMLHTKPIPRGGGIPLFLGVLLPGLFLLPMTKVTISLFVASSIALFIGSIDDKQEVSRYLRLGINILCAVIIVSSGIGVPFITNPLGGILHLDTIRFSFEFFGHHSILPLSDGVALIWIVWVMNMLNWSKGVDGQMPGVVGISAFVIGLLSLRFSQNDPLTATASTLSFLLTGTTLGFLIYNFYPAKIFPGYGATAIYLLLATTSILSGAKLATAILVMGVPLIDGTFTILRRIFSGRSPFWGDKKHLHHLLLAKGLGQRRVALFYWLISAIVGALALLLPSSGKLFVIIMLAVVLTGGLLFLNYTVHKQK